MKTFIFVLLAVVLVFFFYQIIMYRAKKPTEDVAVYDCDICGDRDCICYQENKKK